MEWIEKIVWHDVVTRAPTEEEKKEFVELPVDEWPTSVFVCDMPEAEDDILVLTNRGGVVQDVCMSYGNCRGYNLLYLDYCGDWEGIIAWAYMPTGKKGEEAANAS